MWNVEFGIVVTLRRRHAGRGLYFIDRCAGVLFPTAFFQSAAYKLPYECRVSGANDYVN